MWDDPPMKPDPRQEAWRRAIDGEDSLAAHMTNETPRHGLDPEPTWALKVATAVIVVIVAALLVLWWSGELAR